jgi:hypothetical protein
MKLHKIEVYVFDFEDMGIDSCLDEIKNMKYLITRSFDQGTADIGEWDDDHELNSSKSDIETFRKHFR